MDWVLMHKNIPVIDITTAERDGQIIDRGFVHNPDHLPVGTTSGTGKDKGKVTNTKLNEWWTNRSIPRSRDGLKAALEAMGLYTSTQLLTLGNALSLSDQYWICPKNKTLHWEDLNFFDNGFDADVGEALFGRGLADIARGRKRSPDNTSDGWLEKRWLCQQPRVLQKGGSGVYRQEPFNEVVATVLMQRLGIPHVPYTVMFDDKSGKYYSLCANFITKSTEFVPAWSITASFPKGNSESNLQYFIRCCGLLGISKVQPLLDAMLVLDYIIANEDRHWGNFGFIRNADTLEWLGLAPIFDSGTSLWYNEPTTKVGYEGVICMPFKKTHAEQIKLVQNSTMLDMSRLHNIENEIIGIYAPNERMERQRSERIAEAVVARCGKRAAAANVLSVNVME